MTKDLTEINETETVIAFSNSEERCTGTSGILESSQSPYLFIKQNEHQLENISEKVDVIDCVGRDRLSLVSSVMDVIQSSEGVINLDISILNQIELLYLLRMARRVGKYDKLRIIYSEPEDYLINEYQNPSIGIENISSIPGYVNQAPLNKPLLLIMLLGFEPSRSKAIYNNVDPDQTFLIIPDPPYKSEWKGRTERKNFDLISTVTDERVMRMHSHDINRFKEQFQRFIQKNVDNLQDWNCRISPLSTKPQSVGLFEYWRTNPGTFSLLHSTPLKHKKLFNPEGIHKTRVLKHPSI